jgi:hypothetical protein
MNLYAKLEQRQAEGRPVRIALIGAGKFGSMYLAQVPRTPGVHLAAIADLSPDAARSNLARVGWKAEQTQAQSPEDLDAPRYGLVQPQDGTQQHRLARAGSADDAKHFAATNIQVKAVMNDLPAKLVADPAH